ncbi:MAG: ribose 5-phosphate isomerase B [Finegoldia magna]|uniref:Ribose 5-phosphate isomerase n=2 Tax=Finegoldia magna TaxID=1260 RepID=B0S403_FINM2|nr:ribose 5-phosphate isomerase B [Finegoldia magna]EGS34333.1 ribose-5-phosphate isomerase B [Finegoldia magna SY403409CC001050417]KXA10703.1 ribose-5-phosphate isomerase B [Finegoldia magna]MBS6928015.1 ribose 5-phosphate isomerase B [Finegoldia magna]MDU1010990.1 ribose 5-phosphate isomerase B [Finegoldia magna]MDU1086855.1 ribose 5-phosphate isomerase B [Finegoldia magna]
MKIAIAADHGGFELKDSMVEYIKSLGNEVVDLGTNSADSVDYPDYAKKVCEEIQKGNSDLGILICGTGIGMSLAANKFEGIRAACVSDVYSAKMSRNHNNANVLCIGARVIGDEVAKLIIKTFLENEFEAGRHQRRVDKIMAFEKENKGL